MDSEVDHYLVLGLPSGEQGAKLTNEDIVSAYRKKALKLHPDKRRDDPNAHENFQKLRTSYEVLTDEKTRKLFDDLLKMKREENLRRSQHSSKRRKTKDGFPLEFLIIPATIAVVSIPVILFYFKVAKPLVQFAKRFIDSAQKVAEDDDGKYLSNLFEQFVL